MHNSCLLEGETQIASLAPVCNHQEITAPTCSRKHKHNLRTYVKVACERVLKSYQLRDDSGLFEMSNLTDELTRSDTERPSPVTPDAAE